MAAKVARDVVDSVADAVVLAEDPVVAEEVLAVAQLLLALALSELDARHRLVPEELSTLTMPVPSPHLVHKWPNSYCAN